MPNWCLNKLEIDGKPEALSRFYENNLSEGEDGSSLSFSRSVPLMDPLKGKSKSTLIPLAVIVWGTKWDACEVRAFADEALTDPIDIARRIGEGAKFYYKFDTAWSPPVEWLEQTAPKYPEISFRLSFVEPGMDFMGEDVHEGGQRKSGSSGPMDYKFASERGLLSWPDCYGCGNPQTEEFVNEELCEKCAEQDLMMRGKPS